jgi:hypothetical protein
VGQLHKANLNLHNNEFGHHIVSPAPNKPDFTSQYDLLSVEDTYKELIT